MKWKSTDYGPSQRPRKFFLSQTEAFFLDSHEKNLRRLKYEQKKSYWSLKKKKHGHFDFTRTEQTNKIFLCVNFEVSKIYACRMNFIQFRTTKYKVLFRKLKKNATLCLIQSLTKKWMGKKKMNRWNWGVCFFSTIFHSLEPLFYVLFQKIVWRGMNIAIRTQTRILDWQERYFTAKVVDRNAQLQHWKVVHTFHLIRNFCSIIVTQDFSVSLFLSVGEHSSLSFFLSILTRGIIEVFFFFCRKESSGTSILFYHKFHHCFFKKVEPVVEKLNIIPSCTADSSMRAIKFQTKKQKKSPRRLKLMLLTCKLSEYLNRNKDASGWRFF